MTISKRVECQRKIEGVYWRHRIWPAQNAQAKPDLAQIISDEQLTRRAEDSLRMSSALRSEYHREISEADLQAEINRMARSSKQPKILAEIFASLGNDPFLVAECVARPLLAERRLRAAAQNLDALHHGTSAIQVGPKESFEAWWSENRTAFNPDDEALGPTSTYTLPPISQEASGCVDDTWREISGDDLPTAREEHTAVWTGSELIVWGGDGPDDLGFYLKTGGRYDPATDTWKRTRVDSSVFGRTGHTAVWTGTEMIVWGGSVSGATSTLSSGGRYNPTTDTWQPTNTATAPAKRYQHAAVWTGSEMIVWGGWSGQANLDTGGRYDPLTDQWAPISTVTPPSARHEHSAVWTGTEMIVWGGRTSQGAKLNTGGRYDPSTDSWRPTSLTLAPVPRALHSAVWTGTQMIIWGGGDSSGTPLATGSLYNPSTDTWSNVSTTSAPTRRYLHSAVWTGTYMVVWGGWGLDGTGSAFLRTGGRYSPATNSWTATSLASAPSARYGAASVWTGTEMIVWGGRWANGFDDVLDTGGRYDPVGDSWVGMNAEAAPFKRTSHDAIWTGSEMLVWGGYCTRGYKCDTGGRYDVATDSWTPISTLSAPVGYSASSAVWTGLEMIVWGGSDANQPVNIGGRYNPATGLWAPMSVVSAPTARNGHTAIWTGSEMIVWGGYVDSSWLGTGGRYSPSTDAWTETSMVSAPSPRAGHIGIWTGAEMVIWGGTADGARLDNGSRYDPSADQWSATSTMSAPAGRSGHSAAWWGEEVLIWGGRTSDGRTNVGGRYRPTTDTWASMSTTSAPRPRDGDAVVWTGSEMLVWGGADGNQYLPDGARYSPILDRWTPMSNNGAPSPRFGHSAVWTGSEMLVWGGAYGQENTRTGVLYCAGMISPEPQPSQFAIRPSPIQDQQVGVPFAITVEALDSLGQRVRLDGAVSLRTLVPGVFVSPTVISLHGGIATTNVSIDRAAEGVSLRASWRGVSGTSSTFTVGAPGSCRFRGGVWTDDFPPVAIPGAVVRLVPISGEALEIVASDGTFDLGVPCKPYSAIAFFGNNYSGITAIFPLGMSVYNFKLSVQCDPAAVNPVLLVPGYLGSTTGHARSTVPTLGASGTPATYNDSAWPDWSPSFSFGGLHQFSFIGFGNVPDWAGLVATLGRISPYYRIGCGIVPVPWDWRSEISEAARTFLKKAIDDAVARSGGRRVWVITHSTGALLARSYLQQQGASSTGGQSAIEKLAMIAPANQGSPKAYYGAEGGMPEAIDAVGSSLDKFLEIYRESAERILESDGDAWGNRICYPHVETDPQAVYLVRNDCQVKDAPFTEEDIAAERTIYHERLFRFFNDRVQSAAELVPASPFLLDNTSNLPRAVRCPRNTFLEGLNAFDANVNASWLIPGNQAGPSPKVKTAIFSGCGTPTVSIIRVDGGADGCRSGLFSDGEPLLRPTLACPAGLQGEDVSHGECKTSGACDASDPSLMGDGTLVLSSTKIPGRPDLETTTRTAGHTESVSVFGEDAARFLCDGCPLASRPVRTEATAPESSDSLVIALAGRAQPYVSDPLGRASGVNPMTSEIEEAIPGTVMKLDESASLLGIGNPSAGSYVLSLGGQLSEEIQLHVTTVTQSGTAAEIGGIVFKGSTPRTVELSLGAGLSALNSPNLDAMPTAVTATALGASPATTRLEWLPPAGIAVKRYRVYRRQIETPHFSLAFTTGETTLDTGDLWAGEEGEGARIYAVAAVDTMGRESFMAGFVRNDDRDHDGLTDAEEAEGGTSPSNGDTDDDGLRDLEERQAGTDPLIVDTDSDGFSDFIERRIGSDPLDSSSTPLSVGSLGNFFTLSPCRLVDTRNAAGRLGGPALQPNEIRSFNLVGVCGVPLFAKALSVNVTVAQSGGSGHLSVGPGDLAVLPVVSTINFAPGQTRANNAIVPLASDFSGSIKVKNGSSGSIQFILDVSGYFE